MNDIKVSIITPSYNQGAFIEETVKSVLNQTYKNIEYIILDACSTDSTKTILQQYSTQINHLIIEKDNGQTDAINKGFKMATGELVGWINSDDLLYRDCIERIVEAYNRRPNDTIYYNSNCKVINANGDFVREFMRKIPNLDYLLRSDYKVLQPGSFYKTSIVKDVNYLDEHIYYCMDLDLWLKLLERGGISDIGGKATSAYREWELTKTNTGGKAFYKEITKILKKHGATWRNQSLVDAYILYLKNFIKDLL